MLDLTSMNFKKENMGEGRHVHVCFDKNLEIGRHASCKTMAEMVHTCDKKLATHPGGFLCGG